MWIETERTPLRGVGNPGLPGRCLSSPVRELVTMR